MITAFKFCARAIFSLLEKTHPPGSQNLSSRNFFSLFYIISTQRSYIYKKPDTNRCFAKLRAISNLFSFFLYTLYNAFRLEMMLTNIDVVFLNPFFFNSGVNCLVLSIKFSHDSLAFVFKHVISSPSSAQGQGNLKSPIPCFRLVEQPKNAQFSPGIVLTLHRTKGNKQTQ